jgi:hypothetical protein
MATLKAVPLARSATLLALSVLVLLTLAACGRSEKPVPLNGQYANGKERYLFSYPVEWDDVSKAVGVAVSTEVMILDQVAVGKFDTELGLLSGVQVYVVKVKQRVKADDLDKQLGELDDLYRQQAARVSGRLSETKTVELGGLKARQYVIEFVFLGRIEAASVQTVTFLGDRQYVVNCQGRRASWNEDVLAGCERVLQSFRFS